MSARFWDLMRHLEGCVVRNSATGLHWRGGWVGTVRAERRVAGAVRCGRTRGIDMPR